MLAGAFFGGKMKKSNKNKKYFTTAELILWFGSTAVILVSFLLFKSSGYISLIASLIGVTFLIFSAKANPIGPFLMIIFSLIYGDISYSFSYYGEMITYIGMTLPMSVFALIAWLKNPYEKHKAEVKINKLSSKEIVFMFVLTSAVTAVFCFILKYFNTANLLFSTVSVTTSFLAAYLTFRRSAYYALAYAANDIVLIVLWTMATLSDKSYISVLVCFAVFLINDLYGFNNWKRLKNKQNTAKE